MSIQWAEDRRKQIIDGIFADLSIYPDFASVATAVREAYGLSKTEMANRLGYKFDDHLEKPGAHYMPSTVLRWGKGAGLTDGQLNAIGMRYYDNPLVTEPKTSKEPKTPEQIAAEFVKAVDNLDEEPHFGEWAVKVRNILGLSQADIGAKCGLNKAQIGALEEHPCPLRMRQWCNGVGLGEKADVVAKHFHDLYPNAGRRPRRTRPMPTPRVTIPTLSAKEQRREIMRVIADFLETNEIDIKRIDSEIMYNNTIKFELVLKGHVRAETMNKIIEWIKINCRECDGYDQLMEQIDAIRQQSPKAVSLR